MAKIKLTESNLRKIISEAVKNVLSEEHIDLEDSYTGMDPNDYAVEDALRKQEEEERMSNYGVTFLRGSAEEVSKMIQQEGGFSQPEYYTSYYGKGVVIMVGQNAKDLNSNGYTKITIDMEKLLKSGVKVKKIDDDKYKYQNNGMWQCLADFVPADCIIDVE